MTGKWPRHELDHINHDKSDNRWDNLREATKSQIQWNAILRRDNVSGFKGVQKRDNKHVARIVVAGKTRHLRQSRRSSNLASRLCAA
jgi:hypothetical protein